MAPASASASIAAIPTPGLSGSRSSRSTIGTVTETTDYLRLLFAKVGRLFCFGCGNEIRRDNPQSSAEVAATLPEGTKLMELLTAHGPDGTNVAELGIGTNEQAILTGNILEDEKILGTCHVAFGASAAIGGEVQVPVHLDCVALNPEVSIGGEVVLRDGELLF